MVSDSKRNAADAAYAILVQRALFSQSIGVGLGGYDDLSR